MDASVIDGLNGRIGVGVGRQQNAFRFRIKTDGTADKIHPAHLGHTLVSKQKRDGLVTPFESFKGAYGSGARIGAQDAIAVGVTLAEVALDAAQYLRIIVNRKQDRFGHFRFFSFAPLRRLGLHARGASFPRSPYAGVVFRLDAPGNPADTCSKGVLCATPFYTP